jgi:hypothetical protein
MLTRLGVGKHQLSARGAIGVAWQFGSLLMGGLLLGGGVVSQRLGSCKASPGRASTAARLPLSSLIVKRRPLLPMWPAMISSG